MFILYFFVQPSHVRHCQSTWGFYTKRCASPVLFIPVKYQRGMWNSICLQDTRWNLFLLLLKRCLYLMVGKNFWLSSCSKWSINVLSASGTEQCPTAPGVTMQKAVKQLLASLTYSYDIFPSSQFFFATEKEFLFPGKCYSHQSTLPCVR